MLLFVHVNLEYCCHVKKKEKNIMHLCIKQTQKGHRDNLEKVQDHKIMSSNKFTAELDNKTKTFFEWLQRFETVLMPHL